MRSISLKRFSKRKIAIVIVLLALILFYCFGILLPYPIGNIRYDMSKPLISDELYYTGAYRELEYGEYAAQVFPEYDTVKDIAEIEFAYYKLDSGIEMKEGAFGGGRRNRYTYVLELHFQDDKEYEDFAKMYCDGFKLREDASFIGKSGFWYEFDFQYMDFDDTDDVVGVVCANTHLNVLSFYLFAGIYDKNAMFNEYLPLNHEMYESPMPNPGRTLLAYTYATGSYYVGLSSIETDIYGRKLCKFVVTGEMLQDIDQGTFVFYFIIQATDEENRLVYYYPDRYAKATSKSKGLLPTELDLFKFANHWNLPLNLDSCESRDLLTSPIENPFEYDAEAVKACVKTALNADNVTLDVLDQKDGALFVVARPKSVNGTEVTLGSTYAMVLTESAPGEYTASESNKTQLSSPLALDEINSFKELVGW